MLTLLIFYLFTEKLPVVLIQEFRKQHKKPKGTKKYLTAWVYFRKEAYQVNSTVGSRTKKQKYKR